MSIKINTDRSINNTHEGLLIITGATTQELTEFIIEQSMLLQEIKVRQDVTAQSLRNLSNDVSEKTLVVEEAFQRLRDHLSERASRRRHAC